MTYAREQIESLVEGGDCSPTELEGIVRQLLAENAALGEQVNAFGSALSDIASGEILRQTCYGPHCDEFIGVATADEMSARAAGVLERWKPCA